MIGDGLGSLRQQQLHILNPDLTLQLREDGVSLAQSVHHTRFNDGKLDGLDELFQIEHLVLCLFQQLLLVISFFEGE